MKTTILTALFSISISLLATSSRASETYFERRPLGDVNGDGQVTVAPVIAILQLDGLGGVNARSFQDISSGLGSGFTQVTHDDWNFELGPDGGLDSIMLLYSEEFASDVSNGLIGLFPSRSLRFAPSATSLKDIVVTKFDDGKGNTFLAMKYDDGFIAYLNGEPLPVYMALLLPAVQAATVNVQRSLHLFAKYDGVDGE